MEAGEPGLVGHEARNKRPWTSLPHVRLCKPWPGCMPLRRLVCC